MPYRFLLSLSLLLLLLSSCRQHCFDYCVEGADEFVIDSYKIRQGKMAILEMQGKVLCDLPPNALDEYQDTIAEDDILTIAIFHPTRQDLMQSINFINAVVGFKVYRGFIEIPDIDSVRVVGLTLDQARLEIQRKFREQIQDVEVFITYKDRLARKVELAGMVAIPYVPVDGKIRLFEVLSKARVPSNSNFFMSYVVRCNEPIAVDLYKLMNLGDMCQNIVMRGGDKIFIADPADSRVMVMGEVGYPHPVNVPYGFISLREAIVAAGGIPPIRGNRNCIQVIRGSLLNPKVYILSWEHIIHLPNESLLLIPGDTVYVATKPITQWNDFMSQLLPSITNAAATYGLYRTFIQD